MIWSTNFYGIYWH